MAGEDDQGKKHPRDVTDGPPKLDRRDVLMGLSTVPALGLFGYAWTKQRQHQQARVEAASATPAAAAGLQEINVAILGAGAQGQVLAEAMLRIPGLRFRAVCDIWTEYNQRRVVNTLKRFKHEVNGYDDYREMLDKEQAIDAVIIATPDFWHAQHTIDCLKAGKHVLLREGDVEYARGRAQHGGRRPGDRQAAPDRAPAPLESTLPALLSEAAGGSEAARTDRDRQRSVEPCGLAGSRRSRSLRDPGGAPEAVPASRTCPSSATGAGTRASAAGRSSISARTRSTSTTGSSARRRRTSWRAAGSSTTTPKTHEWYDTVMVVYDYDTPLGPAKAYYQTQTTNGSQGYFETFMGDQGTLLISESEVNYAGQLYRDPNAPAWDEWIQKGYVSAPKPQEAKEKSDSGAIADVRESVAPDQHTVPVALRDPYHQPHLQNFFDAVRGKAKLNCPPEIGYESAVSVLKVNEAIEAKSRLSFTPEDFKV